jgi:hypothetical protein
MAFGLVVRRNRMRSNPAAALQNQFPLDPAFVFTLLIAKDGSSIASKLKMFVIVFPCLTTPGLQRDYAWGRAVAHIFLKVALPFFARKGRKGLLSIVEPAIGDGLPIGLS